MCLAFVLSFAGITAQAQCDDIFTNINANSSFYNLTDSTGNILFDGAACGPLFISPSNVLVTGDLVLFNVTCGNTYTWTTCGLISFDSYMRIWNAADLSLVGENDDDFGCGPNVFASTLTWQSNFDGSIWLSVNEWPCNPLNQVGYDLLMQCSPGQGCTVPANDDVCQAEFMGTPVIGTPVSSSWDNTFASADGPSPGPGTVGPGPSCDALDGWCSFETLVDNDLWFTFIAPASGNVDIEAITDDLFGDTQMALWQIDDCFSVGLSAVEIAANDDGGTIFMSRIHDQCGYISLTPGELYYIQIDGYAGWTGTGVVEVREVPAGGPTPNDDPCTAEVIPSVAPGSSATVAFDNTCANPSAATPGAGTIGAFPSCDAVDGWCSFETVAQNDVWFSYTVPAGSGGSINFACTFDQSPFDTQIAVWDVNGDCGNIAGFTELGANDDGGNLFSSSLTLDCLEPGTTVYIQVDGFSGTEGSGTVTITDLGIAPLEVDAGPCATVYNTGCENLAPTYGCTELTASAMGGVEGYTYSWTDGNGNPVGNTASVTVCPLENTLYTVVVTDQRGCSALDDVFVSSIDVRCGPPPTSGSGSSGHHNSGSGWNDGSGSGHHGSGSSEICTETGVVLCYNPNLSDACGSSSSGHHNSGSGSNDGGGHCNGGNNGHGQCGSGHHNHGSHHQRVLPTYNICVSCACAADYLASVKYSLGPCNQIDCEAAQSNPQPAWVNGQPVPCSSNGHHGSNNNCNNNNNTVCYGPAIYKGFCRSSSDDGPCYVVCGSGSGSGHHGSGDHHKWAGEAGDQGGPVVKAYPNPFNQTTTISFTFTENTTAVVEIFDVTGVKVATVFNGAVNANVDNKVVFDGSNEAAGVYLYKITTATGVVKTDKLYLSK